MKWAPTWFFLSNVHSRMNQVILRKQVATNCYYLWHNNMINSYISINVSSMKALDYTRPPTLWYRWENMGKRGKVACQVQIVISSVRTRILMQCFSYNATLSFIHSSTLNLPSHPTCKIKFGLFYRNFWSLTIGQKQCVASMNHSLLCARSYTSSIILLFLLSRGTVPLHTH